MCENAAERATSYYASNPTRAEAGEEPPAYFSSVPKSKNPRLQ